MHIVRLIPAAMALLLAACASNGSREGDRPDWLDGSSKRYPATTHLVGIGSADELSTARDRARADLAKTFRVAINERSSDTQSYSSEDGGQYSAELRRDLSITTEQVLEGVTVPESWRDPETKRQHALAVLNRAQAAATLRQDINGLDAAAETLLNRARMATDHHTRAQLALDVVDNQRRRAALDGMLRAVSPTGTSVAPRWPLGQLEADMKTALSRITLRATGNQPWSAMLAGQLADSGFSVSPSGEYAVELRVDESASRRDGWHWLRAVAVMDVQGPNGASLGQKRWEFKESATDEETAKLRLREAIAATLGTEGRDAILGTLKN